MKVLINYSEDFGRNGDLDWLFVCERSDFEKVKGKKVYYSDILGKHSEIGITIDDECCEIKSEDQEFIAKLVELIGHETISGSNLVADALERMDEE